MRRPWKIGNKEHFPDEKRSAKNKAVCVRLIKGLKEHGDKLQKIPKDVSELLKNISHKSTMHDRTGK